MKASTTMTRDVVCVPPELPLRDAWSLMQERRIRHLPVVQNGALVGLLSDRDILLRAIPDARGVPTVEQGVVGEAMTFEPRTCHAATSISQLAQTMIDHKIDALPVVTEADGRKLVGLVTSTDLLWLLVGEEPRTLSIDDAVSTVAREDSAAA
jgi:acetoin utilization protein AcuB